MNKHVARHLAKAIIELGAAEWNEIDVKNIRRLTTARRNLNRLFNESGYEFGAGDGSRIRQKKA
jgi:hypothetical protein